MNKNMGSVDRALRIIVGLLLIGSALSGAIGWWGWIGIVPLLTGVLSRCPAYHVLGVNSCGSKGCDTQ